VEEKKYYCRILMECSKSVKQPFSPRHKRKNNGEWILNKQGVGLLAEFTWLGMG
jgi:hypothetical protein